MYVCVPGNYHTPPVDPNAAGAAPAPGAPCQASTPQPEAEAGGDAAAEGRIAEVEAGQPGARVAP